MSGVFKRKQKVMTALGPILESDLDVSVDSPTRRFLDNLNKPVMDGEESSVQIVASGIVNSNSGETGAIKAVYSSGGQLEIIARLILPITVMIDQLISMNEPGYGSLSIEFGPGYIFKVASTD